VTDTEFVVHGTFYDVPVDPFLPARRDRPDQALRATSELSLLVRDGVVTERGEAAALRSAHPAAEILDLSGGLVLPGFVDTHVHYPQIRVIGGLGQPLLEWLETCALPEESRLADVSYARAVAGEFLTGLAQAGTTTALVFGSHFASAIDVFCSAAARSGLRITVGQVVADRGLRPELLTTPERALSEGTQLLRRWHGTGRIRYAVTPRFALTASPALLEACGELQTRAPGILVTSHVNENDAEVAAVASLFPALPHYLASYATAGLVHAQTVLAHNVRATDPELDLLAGVGAHIAHCPTSNAALGSGLFPMRRHVEAGVSVALGSDVGAGTGFCLLKEGLQAYFAQRLLGTQGWPLTATELLYLATAAGAAALGFRDTVGDFSVGKSFDAVWLRPRPGTTLAHVLATADETGDSDDSGAPGGPVRALSAVFALGTPADIAGVWVAGSRVHTRG